MKKNLLLSLIALSTLLSSCFEDLDDNIQFADTIDIQDFIYRGLNYYYLYKADTPELANDAFINDQAKNEFLQGFETPESLFSYLKSPQDRFSILIDDYVILENSLSGITLNNGMEFGLVFYPDNSGNVFGYVRYVLPNTSASEMNLQRGDIFNKVNGVQLTENNFNELLAPDTYTLSLATFNGQTITETNEEVTLTKVQYTENPVLLSKTLTIENEKIGYLMYNAFTRSFVSDLNAAFGEFAANGVTELVLDLRYNGGGSVETATDLASMITGQFNNQVFYSEQWNEDRQADEAEDGLFDNTITGGAATNSLNLNRVFVLTTQRTASASELVINGLEPYIDVVQIGLNTTGKFQASRLLYDAPAPDFNRSQANPGHTYAMLPLIFKTANANGNTDYIDGLIPDIELGEDFSNLGMLGDVNEPLLAEAIEIIVPSGRPSNRNFTQLQVVSERKEMLPFYQILLADK
ncbi:S41 family peptidase [Cochleicola gelatinilyticus]|uniref:Peptidase S41 n=1 Tax=Cochleicola gelatinilyticus TaxID=1763537 RepID=A0A167H3M9_9FLAO|nr:S41 family peptidase [Cochleicola gelatinilyticus]OAB78182.1 peptidase S41 [Cochleicola gelatinilyticus]